MPLGPEAKGQSESVCRTIKSITVFKLFMALFIFIHHLGDMNKHSNSLMQRFFWSG